MELIFIHKNSAITSTSIDINPVPFFTVHIYFSDAS